MYHTRRKNRDFPYRLFGTGNTAVRPVVCPTIVRAQIELLCIETRQRQLLTRRKKKGKPRLERVAHWVMAPRAYRPKMRADPFPLSSNMFLSVALSTPRPPPGRRTYCCGNPQDSRARPARAQGSCSSFLVMLS